MDFHELKNYGKPLSDLTTIAQKEKQKQINAISFKVIKDNLGLLTTIRHLVATLMETRRLSKIDLTEIRQRGLTNKAFIKSQIEFAAAYSALGRMIGREKTLAIFNAIMEQIAPIAFPIILPTADEFRSCGDAWEAWKAYMAAMAEADQQAGCHVIDIVENSEDAFQMNCTYCAWYEIPKTFGLKEACLPSCYGDDVYFPEACRELGIEFKRTNTLARGGDCCDFRFERITG